MICWIKLCVDFVNFNNELKSIVESCEFLISCEFFVWKGVFRFIWFLNDVEWVIYLLSLRKWFINNINFINLLFVMLIRNFNFFCNINWDKIWSYLSLNCGIIVEIFIVRY